VVRVSLRSDVGAAHKGLFIPIACVTAALYVLTLFLERTLRHLDRLPTDRVGHRARNFDIAAIVFGTIGAISLVLLACLDAFNHSVRDLSLQYQQA
jgi:Frag1/DRAM/Sfk1 family